MPNHITNVLIITGPAADLERFRKKVSAIENPTLLQATIAEVKEKIKGYKDTLKTNPTDTYAANKLQEYTDKLAAIEAGKNPKDENYSLDFNGTVPMPESVKNTTSPCPENEKERQAENERLYGAGDWYAWAIKYYGTKWGAYEVSGGIIEDETLAYRFNTAWSPPTQWLVTTSELFPTLTFKDEYIDEGGGAGCIIIKEGSVDSQDWKDHDWLMLHDEGYKEEYEDLTEGDYQEIITEYAKAGSIYRYAFEKILLDRIQDEDLLLFTNFEWQDEEVEEAYKERLADVPKPQKKSRKHKTSKKGS